VASRPFKLQQQLHSAFQSFLALNNSGLEECSAGRSSVLREILREVSAPHKEAYGKLFAPITKTYSRKKLKKDSKKVVSEDTPAKKAIKVRPAVTMKKGAGKALKAAIPDTKEGMRRSPRIKSLLDGHKKIIKATKLKLAVNPTDQGQSMPAYDSEMADPSEVFPGPVKFPTLMQLDKAKEPFPEIPIQALQEVAVKRCGAPPEEVHQEVLTGKRVQDNSGQSASAQPEKNG
jgi:hypothetical protein